MSAEQTRENTITYMEVLCLEESDDNFWGIRYLSNKDLVVNTETGESITEILCYVRFSNGTVYSFEFKNFARICLLKMLRFWCQKNSLLFSIPVLLAILYGRTRWWFIDFFLNLLCSYHYGLAGTRSLTFIWK